MYVNEKMKLNKFEYVAIPKNRDYFTRFGNNLPKGQMYTGDETAPRDMTKMEMLHEANNIDLYNQYKEANEKSNE